MTALSYRRLTGLAFGAILGLTYGLVSQILNRILLRGIPLYQPPLGPAGNILAFTLAGGTLGVICAWMEGSIAATAVASVLCAVVMVAVNLIDAGPTGNLAVGIPMVSIFVSLMLWGLMVPAIAVLRWGVNKLVDGHYDRVPLGRRLLVPAALVVAVGLVGSPSLYRAEARFLLAKTNVLLQQGQRAATADALPAPLVAPDVGSFIERGRASYTLAWEQNNIEKYRIPRPGQNFDNHTVVVARFESGWNLVCLYVTLDDSPLCKGFEELPR